MFVIKWNAQREMDAMKAEWKCTGLTFQATAAIDSQLAEAFASIQKDFVEKHEACWDEINKRESITIEV